MRPKSGQRQEDLLRESTCSSGRRRQHHLAPAYPRRAACVHGGTEKTEVKKEEEVEKSEDEVKPNKIHTDLEVAGVEAPASEGRLMILGLKKKRVRKSKEEAEKKKKETYLAPSNRTW